MSHNQCTIINKYIIRLLATFKYDIWFNGFMDLNYISINNIFMDFNNTNNRYNISYKLYIKIEKAYYQNIVLLSNIKLEDIYFDLDTIKRNNRVIIESVLDLINLKYYNAEYIELMKKLSNRNYDQDMIINLLKNASLNPNIININTKIELLNKIHYIFTDRKEYNEIIYRLSEKIKKYNNYAHPNVFYENNLPIDIDVLNIICDMHDSYFITLLIILQYILINGNVKNISRYNIRNIIHRLQSSHYNISKLLYNSININSDCKLFNTLYY